MVQVVENPDQFFNVPEGVPTVCDLAEKNENNQFELEISAKERLSADVLKITFKFPNPEWYIGLPVAQHIILFKPAEVEGGRPVARPYTPVSPLNQKGSIDFVIKCHPLNEAFPGGGVMG